MRSNWMLISLILLSVLIHETQGIRLMRNGIPADHRQHNIYRKILRRERSSNHGVKEAVLCKVKDCSGNVRKLVMTPILSTTASTTATNDNNEENKAHPKSEGSLTNKKSARKEENLSVNSSSSIRTEPRQPAAPETYPDILDIAGMDYSQARRKPPIHN